MWARDNGGFSLTFDALPVPSMGQNGKLEVRAMAFEPKPFDGQRGGGGAPSGGGGFSDQDYGQKPDDSEIPF